MAIITSRTDLSQGQSNTVTGAIFATGTGADIRIHTNTANNLPALAAGEFFEVRNHSSSQNNGLYQVVTVTTSTDDYECDKVNGLAPVTAGAEEITTLGATGTSTEKSVFIDTAGLGIYLLEQGNLSVDGVVGKAFYSFIMQEYKDDDFLIYNAPFPMLTIDSDAGKYIVGQDPNGNNNGFTFVDDATFSIRTRKLLRNMGWDEIDADGNIVARYVGVVTLGDFEDPANDVAYYQFGTDTTVNDTVDFDFAGPVNEAVQFYDLIGDLSGDTPSFASTSTITRASGSFITDGFKVGGKVAVLTSTSNNGSYILTGVSATTLTVTGTPLTVEAWGTAQIAVDNSNEMTLRLRIRDGDTYGKTFAQANLASAGKSVLGNFVYAFPLANATDLKIEATDADMTSAPYNGMSITYYATPQAKSGLVGGSYNFGIIIDGNDGTAQQVYEYVQYQLRQTTDIDADADTAIGRTMDGLMRFVGDNLEVGSTDGGLTYPTNPDGGGSGVFIENLNAASTNNVSFFDNTGASRSFPETIAITLDFNATLISDTVAEADLFYDRTIRTPAATLTDLVITNATSKITSVGGNLPTNSQIAVDKYIRVSGLTSTNAPGNGVYQIAAINTAGEDWSVVRYDGQAIPDVTSSAADLDQNVIDTPDAIVVHTNIGVDGSSDISFTAPSTIGSTGPDLSVFSAGDRIQVGNTTSNNGFYTVTGTPTSGSLSVTETTLVNESNTSASIDQMVSLLASADYTFAYDFDGNTQGGRTVSTTTYVKAKAIGASTAQYTESTVQTIQSGTPLTIPLVSQTERNYE